MKEKGSKPRGRLRALLLILAVGIVLAVLLLLVVLFRLNLLSAPALLRDLLHLPDSGAASGYSESGGIPDILPDDEELRDLFYDLEPSELLSTLTERNSYIRTIRVIHSYGSEHVIRHYTIARQGNLWRADSDDGKLIWNGRELYREEGDTVYRSDSGDFNFFEEIGVTPLNQIRHTAEEKGCHYSLSDSGKTLNITILDSDNGIRNEYGISVESGVVVSETSYYQNAAFRTVLTDSIDYFGADSLPEDYFMIP